ncbi:MAG: family 10 glycosylhydrolase [Candidatus Bathyarchaeia archaeon]
MKNQKLTATLLTIILATEIITLSIAAITNNIKITNYGRIQTYRIFDTCDHVGGWRVVSNRLPPNAAGNNTIEPDTSDKVEGTASLKMTFATDSPNWGGCFYKEFTAVDLRSTPILRIRFKAHNQLPSDFKFGIRAAGVWSGYNISKHLTRIGEWLTVDVDLRLPDWGEKFPNLQYVSWIEFSSWNSLITTPVSFNIDHIEAISGPIIPLEARIKPTSAWTEVEVPVSFEVDVKGGVEPYTYTWKVNETLQSETRRAFSYSPSMSGNYTIRCTITDSRGSNVNVTAALEAEVIIPPPPSPASLDVFKSDIRGVFIHNWMLRNPNWTRIAETCLRYGINTIVVEISATEIWDASQGRPKFYQPLKTAVDTFHSYGFKVHVLAVMGMGGLPGMQVVRPDGSTYGWLCWTRGKQAWLSMIQSLVLNYSIDGFMFDYIRWRDTAMCFCNECKAKFIADTGLSDVNWPTDCLEGGRYYWQFIQWRLNPVTEMVRDAAQLMRSLKPDMMISAAVFTAFDNCGNYWVVSLGQHTADWVDKGYLDFVCPMIYTSSVPEAVGNMLDSMNFYTGGVEGKVPTVPFITFLQLPDEFTPMPVETFVNIVRALKQNGADGWIIWRYGGPGFEQDPFRKFADIRAHLAALINEGLMPPVWAIQNLQVTVMNATHVAISWTTTVPTNATMEYTDGKIFYANIRYGDFGRPIYYKDIEYNGTNTKKIYQFTYSTEHSFIMALTNLTQFRIQCTDINGVTITTKPMGKTEITSP